MMMRAASRSLLILAPIDRGRPAAVFVLALLFIRCAGPEPHATLHDDVGRSVTVAAHPRRIVSLAPNLTEIVYALGCGDRIVGVDDNSDEPAAARTKPRVGGMQPSIERIASLKPDLVIASTQGNQPSLAPALAAANIPLYVVRTDRLTEIAPAMARLATALGCGDRRVPEKLRADLAAFANRKRAHAPRVLFAVWMNPLYVAGRNNFADDLINLCGARNAVGPNVTGWPLYSLETLVAEPPDLIIYPDREVTPAQVEELLRRVPSLRGRTEIVGVDENLFTRPGPRVAQAAARLNAIVDQWERRF